MMPVTELRIINAKDSINAVTTVITIKGIASKWVQWW